MDGNDWVPSSFSSAQMYNREEWNKGFPKDRYIITKIIKIKYLRK